ncbi:MAG: 16S rRNA (adenine(1518)-N(6)/adenine(1519)-N(6))-dimethyltransferase RsmA [Anaerolineales bacterium]|nr:16S rRNA (adenine(1518)-N(6)/adenine(1519)-N(6))-dimethyltransferase RsmA [Anaerolineales bacterium]
MATSQQLSSSLDLPPLHVPALLRKYGLKPDRRLGQVFLVEPIALQRVVEAAEILTDDSVLEIGAGLGSLTRYLAAAASKVVAVEVDERIMPALQEILTPFTNISLVYGDILELDPAELMGQAGYLVVANIPYYITSVIMRHLLETRLRPQRVVLTVQREVAGRICAQPGEMNLLALSVQVYGKPRISAYIPAGSFYPLPKVDSAVIRVDIYPTPVIPYTKLDLFFRLAKAGFSQKRKTLRNALVGGLAWKTEQVEQLLQAAGIDPRRRAETLSLEEWQRLVEGF